MNILNVQDPVPWATTIDELDRAIANLRNEGDPEIRAGQLRLLQMRRAQLLRTARNHDGSPLQLPARSTIHQPINTHTNVMKEKF